MIYHIILAAGLSRRFGSNKLLYEVDGIPMYARALSGAAFAGRRLGGRTIFVVSNCRVAEKAAVETAGGQNFPNGLTVVFNHRPEAGISYSIRLGILAAKASFADWLLFSVCDQPWLTGEEICRLAQEGMQSGRGIAALSWKGQAGNPVMFKGIYQEELLSLSGDRGGKSVLRAHPEDTFLVEAGDKKMLEDLDERP